MLTGLHKAFNSFFAPKNSFEIKIDLNQILKIFKDQLFIFIMMKGAASLRKPVTGTGFLPAWSKLSALRGSGVQIGVQPEIEVFTPGLFLQLCPNKTEQLISQNNEPFTSSDHLASIFGGSLDHRHHLLFVHHSALLPARIAKT